MLYLKENSAPILLGVLFIQNFSWFSPTLSLNTYCYLTWAKANVHFKNEWRNKAVGWYRPTSLLSYSSSVWERKADLQCRCSGITCGSHSGVAGSKNACAETMCECWRSRYAIHTVGALESAELLLSLKTRTCCKVWRATWAQYCRRDRGPRLCSDSGFQLLIWWHGDGQISWGPSVHHTFWPWSGLHNVSLQPFPLRCLLPSGSPWTHKWVRWHL